MGRITFWFKNNDSYVSVVGDKFYETTEGKICAFNGEATVAKFDADIVKGVYLTHDKSQKEVI